MYTKQTICYYEELGEVRDPDIPDLLTVLADIKGNTVVCPFPPDPPAKQCHVPLNDLQQNEKYYITGMQPVIKAINNIVT